MSIIFYIIKMAQTEGIEPPPRGLEALVLPLHYVQIKLLIEDTAQLAGW